MSRVNSSQSQPMHRMAPSPQVLNEPEHQSSTFANRAFAVGKAFLSVLQCKPLVAFTCVNAGLAILLGAYKPSLFVRQSSSLGMNLLDSNSSAREYPTAVPSRFSEYLHNGTFGAPRTSAEKIDGVMVSRGDRLSNVIPDPYKPGGGIILSNLAKATFDKFKNNPEAASPEGRFRLAVEASIIARNNFLMADSLRPDLLNRAAEMHTRDSKGINGLPSPYVSLTLNEYTAAYFGLGGVDNKQNPTQINKDGRVFVGSVNNKSTIFPVVGRAVKNVQGNPDIGKFGDVLLKFSDDLKVPVGELLVVGGYYFHDSISLEQGFNQNPKKFRKIPDLYKSTLSLRMIQPNRKAFRTAEFEMYYPRVKRYLKNNNEGAV